MKKTWGKPIYIVLAIPVLIFGLRAKIFRLLIRNRTIRNLGLRLLLSVPAFRNRMIQQVFGTPAKTAPDSQAGGEYDEP